MAEGTTDAAVFLKDISHPPGFGDPQDCARNRLCSYALGPHQFALGAAGTGSPMHTHQDAWNALIYGRKRWFIAPPAQANYSYTHIRAWMEADYPQLPPSQRPLECVQRAGEVMYVPGKRGQLDKTLGSCPSRYKRQQTLQGSRLLLSITLQAPISVLRTGLFGHAILNLADSIAIAVEFQHASRLIPFTMAEWFNLPVKAEEWGSGTQFAGSHAMDPFFENDPEALRRWQAAARHSDKRART